MKSTPTPAPKFVRLTAGKPITRPFTFLLIFLFIINGSAAQRLSRDLKLDLLVNHAGYLPDAPKYCVGRDNLARGFSVVRVSTGEVIFSGRLEPQARDFGEFSLGDFSQVTEPGTYYILSDTLRSYPFTISSEVYVPAMESILSYFSRQRCGPSTTGYLTPCHLDDGVRMDNGAHQDVSGGWHDASDLRKWVGATIYGMVGIAKTCELQTGANRDSMLEELRWGNRYFLAMQEPEGYIMSYVGGDVLKHSDSNRWTDNETGEDEGELGFVLPNAGESTAEMLIIGSKDDRVIKTDPLGLIGQYNFVTAQAILARIMSDDQVYSQKCLEAAKKCFSWANESEETLNPGAIGASIQAALELFNTTADQSYAAFAFEKAQELAKLQYRKKGKIEGFFFQTQDQKEPYKNIWNGCMEFYAVSDLLGRFPNHADAVVWKEIVSTYAYQYLQNITQRNTFGIVPFGLYANQDPGGNRKIGPFWYRYFMQPELSWWVGVNSNLAASGIAFHKAAEALNDPELMKLAQRQLDWILGVNPLGSSTLIGTGYNHPEHFPGSTFLPRTPIIPGAVMNGLGGDADDQPVIGTGNWQISEYWTPMVAHTLWLMAELTDHAQKASK